MQYNLPAVSLSAPGFGSCIHGLRCPHRQWAEEGSLLGSTTLEETQCKNFALCAATHFPQQTPEAFADFYWKAVLWELLWALQQAPELY